MRSLYKFPSRGNVMLVMFRKWTQKRRARGTGSRKAGKSGYNGNSGNGEAERNHFRSTARIWQGMD